jgi:hypothetical protein
VSADDLIGTYPLLFHMAEAGSWDSIRMNGLRSTSALLDLFEIEGDERRTLERQRRPVSRTIYHPVHGEAVIRDQKPLIVSRLENGVLTDMTVEEWCITLNERVFFWTTEERLLRLLRGFMYRGQEHDVLVVDTASLVAAYGARITLAPYNTGATVQTAPPRGSNTFQRIDDYDFDGWRRRRSRREAVVELAVDYAVPDIEDFVVRVERRREAVLIDVLYER